jgi:hypothetical protein
LEGRIFISFIKQGEQVQGKVMENFGVGKSFYLVFLEKEENECVGGELVCYV